MQGTELAQTFEQTDTPDNTINNNFQDIEAFLERVLVQNPVSIDAELVPPLLSRGLGLNNDSSSVGQQGSNGNDRRVTSGKPWSSVSNDAQGATGNNNITANAMHKIHTGKNLHGKHALDETNATLCTKAHGMEHQKVVSLE